ncbi:MAG: VWA domain-containing protein [Acidobacteria bacterium]|nr:VWA domain-containing protein [Acidobacteriota bacterium]
MRRIARYAVPRATAGRTAAAVVLFAAALSAARQNLPAQDPSSTFRSGVDLIQLDVSVLDRNRHPVTDLTAADFVVRVDGQPRPVVAFKAVTLPPPLPPPSAPWMRDVAPDVATNRHPAGRAIVILIDDNTVAPMSSQAGPSFWMRKARATARRVVDELGPDDVAAVVFTSNNHTAQGFTSDRDRLLRAIDGSVLLPPAQLIGRTGTSYGKTYNPDQNGYCYCGACSIDALANIAESLRSLPQQRKIVIYISSGVAVRPDISETCNMLRREAQLSALRKAALANVTINPIDPEGIRVEMNDPESKSGYLRTMAESTGGRAVINNNDMDLEVPGVLAESSSYYLLGVESAGLVQDGRLHEIDVRVGRPDLEVRTRKGYYAPTAKERHAIAAAAASRDLDGAIEGVLPKRDFPMDVTIAPFGGDRQGTLAVVLGATHPSNPAGGGTPRAERAEVVASLFNPESGRLIGSRRLRLDVAWNGTEASASYYASAGYYEVVARLPAASGRYEVRLGLETGDGLTSSVYTFAEVPNFSREAISLSGLVMSVQPAAHAVSSDALADLMPIVPTVRRTFRRTDRVSAFLRVYQKKWATLVTLTARIIDTTNERVSERIATVASPAGAASNGAAHLFDVPVAGLSSGSYLLTVDASANGKTATRQLRFQIE